MLLVGCNLLFGISVDGTLYWEVSCFLGIDRYNAKGIISMIARQYGLFRIPIFEDMDFPEIVLFIGGSALICFCEGPLVV